MGFNAFNPKQYGLMVFVHEQVNLATLDGPAHILGGEGAQTFQVDFRTEWDHCRVYGYGVVCLGVPATEGDPVTFAAAEWTGAVGGDFHHE